MPCDTPKETQLAAGRARIQTQAEWCTHHPQRSGSGMHWGDGDGVAFVLTATLGLTLQVPHGSVGVSVGGGTGVWQSQVRKAQSMLRSPRRGQAVALAALCVSSHPGGAAASLPCVLRCRLSPSFLVYDVVLRSTALLLVTVMSWARCFSFLSPNFHIRKKGIKQYLPLHGWSL